MAVRRPPETEFRIVEREREQAVPLVMFDVVAPVEASSFAVGSPHATARRTQATGARGGGSLTAFTTSVESTHRSNSIDPVDRERGVNHVRASRPFRLMEQRSRGATWFAAIGTAGSDPMIRDMRRHPGEPGSPPTMNSAIVGAGVVISTLDERTRAGSPALGGDGRRCGR